MFFADVKVFSRLFTHLSVMVVFMAHALSKELKFLLDLYVNISAIV